MPSSVCFHVPASIKLVFNAPFNCRSGWTLSPSARLVNRLQSQLVRGEKGLWGKTGGGAGPAACSIYCLLYGPIAARQPDVVIAVYTTMISASTRCVDLVVSLQHCSLMLLLQAAGLCAWTQAAVPAVRESVEAEDLVLDLG